MIQKRNTQPRRKGGQYEQNLSAKTKIIKEIIHSFANKKLNTMVKCNI